jgi:hypothetical protein
MLNSEEDFKKLIEKTKEILIISPENSIDLKVSSFALVYFLENLNKKVTLFSSKKDFSEISFLPKPINTISNLNGLRDFQLIFNTEKNKIVNVKTNQKENKYIINITPEKGIINPRDFSFIPAKFKFDLIVILGSPSMENLGDIYLSNTDLFFEIPKINIDFNPSNENYGQVNIIDETASSVSEILAELFFNNNPDLIDKKISQSLLTGIISATESFQIPTTSPKTMNLAAQLIKKEADQPTIVRYLYRNKELSFLKLWGRIMARLNWDKNRKIVWSLISQEDFTQSSSNESMVLPILEEIQKSFPQNQTCLIIYTNQKNESIVLIKIIDEKKMMILKEIYSCQKIGQEILKIKMQNKNLIETEKELFEKIKASEF